MSESKQEKVLTIEMEKAKAFIEKVGGIKQAQEAIEAAKKLSQKAA